MSTAKPVLTYVCRTIGNYEVSLLMLLLCSLMAEAWLNTLACCSLNSKSTMWTTAFQRMNWRLWKALVWKDINSSYTHGFSSEDRLHFDQVPILEIDDFRLSQSMTIARYIARKNGLYGSNEEEAARCDEVVDGVRDLNTARGNARTVCSLWLFLSRVRLYKLDCTLHSLHRSMREHTLHIHMYNVYI